MIAGTKNLTLLRSIGVVALIVTSLYLSEKGFHQLSDESKLLLRDVLGNAPLRLAEKHGVLLESGPPFNLQYVDRYPELQLLEDNWEVIRDELEFVLQNCSDSIISDFNKIRNGSMFERVPVTWKSFFLKLGTFLQPNAGYAPRTVELLRRIPGLQTAFFSIIHPHQYLVPHWGLYKGLLRYQLGLKVPNNNNDNSCYIRLNQNILPTHKNKEIVLGQRSSVFTEQGDWYFWKNGEGVMFDDTFLHDAANESDEIRVVLFLDLVRRDLPWYLDIFNSFCLWAASRDSWFHEIRKEVTVEEGRCLSVLG